MLNLEATRSYLQQHGLDGWLLYDFDQINPIFWEAMGSRVHVTRPCWLFVPPDGQPILLVHRVDVGHFAGIPLDVRPYLGRIDMQRKLADLLQIGHKVAMEYSPLANLPAVSRVDGGTLDLVKSFGVEVVSSASLIQSAIARLNSAQTEAHRRAATKLTAIVHEAFEFIGQHVAAGIAEHDVCDFIRERFLEEKLFTDSGPIVAANEHSGDPHYEPPPKGSREIRPGEWILIDLWARDADEQGIFADITWVGYLGDPVPDEHRRVFDTVIRARDIAFDFVDEAWQRCEVLEGWQVDEKARDFIAAAGYARYFTHRLGHNLGHIVHGYGVNLDNFETKDHRPIVPGIAFTIEPGIYLPEFGVRSEMNVYLGESGPEITTPPQRDIVLIEGRI
ncbi:MAG: aminopeptidase P family protein [Chloroflexi bacterium]|nr:aminopeptidase P family protein [Chloroflexota bacterium]